MSSAPHLNVQLLLMKTRTEIIEEALARARRTEDGRIRVTDLCREGDPVVSTVLRAHPEIDKKVSWAMVCGRKCYVARMEVARDLISHVPTNKLRRYDAPSPQAAPPPTQAPAALEAAANPAGPPVSLAPATPLKRSTEPEPALDSGPPQPGDFASQMSTLLGHTVAAPRMTPEGHLALIDVAMTFTGLDNNQAGLAVRRLLNQYPEFQSTRLKFKFPGRGRQTVDVAPLATALEFAFLLPGRHAAKVRRQAAILLVRFLGADMSLIDEIFRNRRVQQALAEVPLNEQTPAEQAVRLCGVAVESSQVLIPPAIEVIRAQDSVGLPGSKHLYAAGRVGTETIKIGVTEDALDRSESLAVSFKNDYHVLCVWPNEAVLEDRVRCLAKAARAEVGSSREHFNMPLEAVKSIVIVARQHYLANTEINTAPDQHLKRKREEMELEADMEDRRLKRAREELDMQARQLVLDLARQGHEAAISAVIASLN